MSGAESRRARVGADRVQVEAGRDPELGRLEGERHDARRRSRCAATPARSPACRSRPVRCARRRSRRGRGRARTRRRRRRCRCRGSGRCRCRSRRRRVAARRLPVRQRELHRHEASVVVRDRDAVMSGALSESAFASANDARVRRTARRRRTRARPRRQPPASAKLTPSSPRSVVQNSPKCHRPLPPPPRRRRRLARPPRVPRTAEDVSARRGKTGQRPARLFQLHHPALAVRAAAGRDRRLGLPGHADLPPRALRGLPGGTRVRRRPARAARPAPGARARVRVRSRKGAGLRGG